MRRNLRRRQYKGILIIHSIVHPCALHIEDITPACRPVKCSDQLALILGYHRRNFKPLVAQEILEMCDTRKDLKKEKNTKERAAKYSEISKKIRNGMEKAKEDWREEQCTAIEDCLINNNSKSAYQVVNELTKQRQVKINTIQDKEEKCLTEEKDVINRWMEYCSELYNFQTKGDPCVLARQES